MNKQLTRLLLFCTLFLSSCGTGQVFGPTIIPSPTPTITPLPTSTKRPTQSPTSTITPTHLGSSSGDILHGTKKNGEEEEIAECCYIIEVSGVHYEGVSGVSRYLHFDVECVGNWPVSPGECIPGETFIGEPMLIPWAEVTCCTESDALDVLHCESNYNVEQKVSWTRVELEYRGCEWNSPRFYSPPYFGGSSPACPFNCSPNYCCDCGAGMGCYADCTGCD